MHVSRELPEDYYEQLTAERLVTRYVKGRPRLEWIKPSGRRNEALDLEVYAIAAAHKIGLNRFRVTDWDALERQVQPAQVDLLTDGAATTPATAETEAQGARRRVGHIGDAPRPGFVKRW
jgi:phage terminase large subunit GpA-like protein